MQATLKLTNPLWKTPERRRILDLAVQQSGAELESEVKKVILNSTPRGKLYRRGAIRRQIAGRDLKFFRSNKRVFRRKFTGLFRETTVVGYNFHRASAKGQSPAVESGGLVNSIQSQRAKPLHNIVKVGKVYGVILDDKQRLDRPFFTVTVKNFREKFKANIQEAINEIAS